MNVTTIYTGSLQSSLETVNSRIILEFSDAMLHNEPKARLTAVVRICTPCAFTEKSIGGFQGHFADAFEPHKTEPDVRRLACARKDTILTLFAHYAQSSLHQLYSP